MLVHNPPANHTIFEFCRDSLNPSDCLQVFLFSGKRIFPNRSEKVFFQKKEKRKCWEKRFDLFSKRHTFSRKTPAIPGIESSRINYL